MGWIKKTFQDGDIDVQCEFSTDSLDIVTTVKTTKENFIEKVGEMSKALTGMVNILGIKEAARQTGGKEAFNEAIRQIRDLSADVIARISEAFSSNMLNDVEVETRFKEDGKMVSYMDGKLIKTQQTKKENMHQLLTAVRTDIFCTKQNYFSQNTRLH